MEKDLRAKLDAAQEDPERAEIKKKLEMVLQKRTQLEAKFAESGAIPPPPPSPDDLKAQYKMLLEKEANVRAELEKTTDEAKKAELAKMLEKVLQKQADVKQMAKPYLTPAIIPSSIEELEKGMLKLQAKEKDIREKLAAVTDPQQKVELENTLRKVLQMQEGYKAGLEKSKAGKIEKTAK